MNALNMLGFTAESSHSISSQGYLLNHLSGGRQINGESDVQVALINTGGGGSESNFSCDESKGTCSCLGGNLSSDCWKLSQHCIDRFDCSPYRPYKCTFHYRFQPQPSPIFSSPSSGGMFTR